MSGRINTSLKTRVGHRWNIIATRVKAFSLLSERRGEEKKEKNEEERKGERKRRTERS